MAFGRPRRTIRACRRTLMYFVAICRDRADGLETRLANRPAHLEFLKAQSERIKVGGPFLTPDGERMIGSVLILQAGDEVEARAILAEDPYGKVPVLQVYRERFQPSEQLERPYAMVGANVIAAETDGEARRLFTSAQQQFTNMLRGTRGQLPPPIDDIESYWSPVEKEQASKMLACSFVGAPETIRAGLETFVERTGADEVIVASAIHDHTARLRSYELLAGIRD